MMFDKRKKFYQYSIIIGVLSLGACNLFPDELPPVSMGGLNTFGCLVDGKLFLPKAPLGYGAGIYVSVDRIADTLGISIHATNTNTHQNLQIYVYDIPEIVVGKVYDLSSTALLFAYYLDYQSDLSCYYPNIISGQIVFSKVEIAHYQSMIVSGTFELVLQSNECNKSVTLTKGRFDVSDPL